MSTNSPMANWPQNWVVQALGEGWMVFNDREIQRDDESAKFLCDEDAVDHVRRRAANGSALHQLALTLHDAP